MEFDAALYGPRVASILALDGGGMRLMPLALGNCSNREAARKIEQASPRELFPEAPHPEAAYAGLWLYFSCLDEAHRTAQQIHTPEGSFWHAIMHRQEPDPGNSAYWFRRTGRHPVFEPLHAAAAEILNRYPKVSFALGGQWDPFAFIDFVEAARRRPGSEEEKLALEVQRAEWQLLFDYCARPAGS